VERIETSQSCKIIVNLSTFLDVSFAWSPLGKGRRSKQRNSGGEKTAEK
jgi:hypothetical protein